MRISNYARRAISSPLLYSRPVKNKTQNVTNTHKNIKKQKKRLCRKSIVFVRGLRRHEGRERLVVAGAGSVGGQRSGQGDYLQQSRLLLSKVRNLQNQFKFLKCL